MRGPGSGGTCNSPISMKLGLIEVYPTNIFKSQSDLIFGTFLGGVNVRLPPPAFFVLQNIPIKITLKKGKVENSLSL